MKYLKLFENYKSEYYHVAPKSKRDDILKNGLRVDSLKRYSGISKNVIYIWEEFELAMWYALSEARDHSMEFDIWKFKYTGEVKTDNTIGIPYAAQISENITNGLNLIDTTSPNDDRIKYYSDVEQIIGDIEYS